MQQQGFIEEIIARWLPTISYFLFLPYCDGGVHVVVAEALRGWRTADKMASPSPLVLPACLMTLTSARSATMMGLRTRRRTMGRMTSHPDPLYLSNSAIWSSLYVHTVAENSIIRHRVQHVLN